MYYFINIIFEFQNVVPILLEILFLNLSGLYNNFEFICSGMFLILLMQENCANLCELLSQESQHIDPNKVYYQAVGGHNE